MFLKFVGHKFIGVIAALLLTPCAGAGELRYTPVNPTFGGNPANASGLMAAATAQNDFKAPTKSNLEKFTDGLESSILNRLQSTVLSQLFNSNGDLVNTGTVNAGNYKIEIKTEDGILNLITTDRTTGETTTVRINALE
jgi:curli production assembly/transport component CsgF